ncbi:unnamed protein product [Linum trigynum]|uniref:Uncharacterized protein n=1 Tax=Linum trigynum TaxID=586398 RepID=A0AAV2E9P1_9ROSI
MPPKYPTIAGKIRDPAPSTLSASLCTVSVEIVKTKLNKFLHQCKAFQAFRSPIEMEPRIEEAYPIVKTEADEDTTPSFKDYVHQAIKRIIGISSSSEEDDSDEPLEDIDSQAKENSANKQLLLYDPGASSNM